MYGAYWLTGKLAVKSRQTEIGAAGLQAADAQAAQSPVVRARGFLRRRFPALGDQPIIGARVCQVAGDSGHAFKHGPAIGAVIRLLVAKMKPAS